MSKFQYPAIKPILATVMLLVCTATQVQAKEPLPKKDSAKKKLEAYTPTNLYLVHHLRKWKVLVDYKLEKENPELFRKAYCELDHQLYQIVRRVPKSAVRKMQKVTIWLELNDKNHLSAVYHPAVSWLKNHGVNPDKAKCVELANAKNFVNGTKMQPFMVLHEMAHAYHDQFVPDGFHNREIIKAHKNAMNDKSYDRVLHINGRMVSHYAKTNHKEYFAESSEAFFGTNDFYPFVKSELKKHDPTVHKVLEKIWFPEKTSAKKIEKKKT